MTRLAGFLALALLLSLVLAGLTFSAANQAPPSIPSTALNTPLWLGNPIAGEEYSARHIWDLQTWRGRVYLGYGDWGANLGPVDIWYYTPTATCFISETVYVSPTRPIARVDEEAIDHYVVIDGDLYIPGTDPKESWEWGNFYRNDGTGWVKYRTIPGGVHCYDMAGYHGELFAGLHATGAALMRSTNGGLTWTAALSEVVGYPHFHAFYELDDMLFVVEGLAGDPWQPVVHRYQAPWFVTTTIALVPDRPADWVHIYGGVTTFGGTALYVPWFWDEAITCTRPITALYQAQPWQDGQHVAFFDGKHPRDVVVAGDWVYVLDAGGPRCVWGSRPPDPAGYTATVYASPDLATWLPVTAAHLPDTPNALEILGGYAYVGTYNGDIYALPLRFLIYLPLVTRNAAP